MKAPLSTLPLEMAKNKLATGFLRAAKQQCNIAAELCDWKITPVEFFERMQKAFAENWPTTE